MKNNKDFGTMNQSNISLSSCKHIQVFQMDRISQIFLSSGDDQGGADMEQPC